MKKKIHIVAIFGDRLERKEAIAIEANQTDDLMYYIKDAELATTVRSRTKAALTAAEWNLQFKAEFDKAQ